MSDHRKLQECEKLVIIDIEEVHSRKYKTLGHIFSCLEKLYDKVAPTAAMEFDPDTESWKMHVNPDFYCRLPGQLHRIFVILHEVSHLLYNHPPRFREFLKQFPDKDKKRAKEILNIAADIIVNDLITDICGHEFQRVIQDINGCTYQSLEVDKHPEDTVEKLYWRIKDKVPENESGPGNHTWEVKKGGKKDGSGKNADQLQEIADHKVRELIESARTETNDFGDLPASVRGLIKRAIKAKINLERELMIEGHGCIRAEKRLYRNRPHRRLGFPFPGKKTGRSGKVIAGLDVSGSVDERHKKQFLDILKKLATRVEVEMCTFDVQIVQHVKSWNIQPVGIKDTGGGTNPQCVFDLANQARNGDRADKVFILTDGEFGDINTHNFRTVFILTPGGYKRPEGKNLFFE